MIDFKAVADFIDLVKNPDKYAAALKSLETRTAELQEAISVYGKATEIGALHEKALKALDAAREKVAKDQAAFDAEVSDVRFKLAAERSSVSTAKTEVSVLEAEAKAAKKNADAVVAEYNRKTAEVEKQIEKNLAREVELSKAQQEVNEKLQKLTSLGL